MITQMKNPRKAPHMLVLPMIFKLSSSVRVNPVLPRAHKADDGQGYSVVKTCQRGWIYLRIYWGDWGLLITSPRSTIVVNEHLFLAV